MYVSAFYLHSVSRDYVEHGSQAVKDEAIFHIGVQSYYCQCIN